MPSWRFYKALGPRGQGHPEPVEGTQEAGSLDRFDEFLEDMTPGYATRMPSLVYLQAKFPFWEYVLVFFQVP